MPNIKSNAFLKFHQQKNDVHDVDREKAHSLIKNLSLPSDKRVLKSNPFFEKEEKSEQLINL